MYGVSKVDGILADLGVSSHQINAPERGFSTRFNAILDMRMSQEGDLTAESIINDYNEIQLQEIFSAYGEVRNARTLAKTIIAERERYRISTVEQLNQICKSFAPQQKLNKYLAQVYQALRIEVNQEMEALEEVLNESFTVLKPD